MGVGGRRVLLVLPWRKEHKELERPAYSPQATAQPISELADQCKRQGDLLLRERCQTLIRIH